MKKISYYRYFLIIFVLCLLISWEMHILKQEVQVITVKEQENDEFLTYMNLVDQIFVEMQCFPVVKEEEEGEYPGSTKKLWRRKNT